MTKDLIDCNSLIDCTCFVTENVAIETIIGLDAGVFGVKMVAGLVLEVVEINEDNMHKKMALI